MKEQNWKLMSILSLVILLIITFTNWFYFYLPDWGIRVVGFLTLLDIAFVTYTHMKR